MTRAEQEAADNKAIAEVEANQTPPPDTPEIQPLSSSEIDGLGLAGGGCSFYRAVNDRQVLSLLTPEAAYLKLDGDVERLASDAGSKSGPIDTRTHYDGKRQSLHVVMGDKGESIVSDTTDYPASLTIRDGKGRVEAKLTGTARCGS
ncbi:hypothetical protein GRI58_06100 [Porphyrobacter algicida]|uniref:Uncharacterized protein n=1 Tax=Qipengyuania algicida TaxID=1836209 RepID=A0A845AD64_9SPHN|nr:hypothetical protein [Qipengyuania algicida]MXP28392.1 hypothetical protein [Qipengyuania algicida]